MKKAPNLAEESPGQAQNNTARPQPLYVLEDAGLGEYVELDRRVDGAEQDAIWARWEFGRLLLAERDAHGGKQLPHGRIEQLCAALKRSPAEIRSRAQFAEEHPTELEVATAVATFRTWTEIRAHFGKRGIQLSESTEWYTPAEYIEAARRALGAIDLDPASCELANRTVGASRFYSLEDDGLAQPWYGRVWMNPPYGGYVASFVGKLVDEHGAGNVEAAIALVSAHAVDTQWFQQLWDCPALCFIDHRITFISPHRESHQNTGGSCFAYFGPDPASFYREFSHFGAIVRRWQP
jgi:hypothetical protein